jgi:formylglycine-generating enzyme required for sulfatase activity
MKPTKPAFLLALASSISLAWFARAQGQTREPTLSLDLGAGARIEMALVKADHFRQGSPAAEADRGEDETVHDVTLTSDYYIGKYEVTVSQFERFVAETNYKTEAENGTSGGFGWNGRALEQRPSFTWRTPGFPQSEGHPVTLVTFNDAMAFANWLSRRTGRSISLPSEAQWEFAARGDSTSAYPSGARKVTEPQALGWQLGHSSGGGETAKWDRPFRHGRQRGRVVSRLVRSLCRRSSHRSDRDSRQSER